eukprot:PLAT3553.11.p2 GENE.PLAT3553.11~~PLAT3553.11.p2  ORF type:complete len:1038 (-),score=643.01 PLAT3553.11:172-3285(-)
MSTQRAVKSFDAFSHSVEEVLEEYGTTLERGLSPAAVEAARKTAGFNELDKEEKASLWELVLEQFDDLLVKILLAAACVSFVLAWFEEDSEGFAAFVEPFVILLILILNAIVGVWQENNAADALEKLKELQPQEARVRREGVTSTIPARELVPGDIVDIRVGDRVPADLRLAQLRTTTLRAAQAELTGESTSVTKLTEPVLAGAVVQEQTNMLFSSTQIVNGNGVGIVVGTGMNTQIGDIQKSVSDVEEEDTPLRKKLDEFGELLSKVIFVICVVVWVINYKNFWDPIHGSVFKGCIYYFKIAVALAVAAIPEGLPAVITTCLALGTRKMAQQNAIVRRLLSVETLGCTSVICSDKTGTLTTNEMSVRRLLAAGAALPRAAADLPAWDVSGSTYHPGAGEIVSWDGVAHSESLLAVSRVCALCNDAKIEWRDGKAVRVGEPTEAALKVLVEKMGVADGAEQAGIESARAAGGAAGLTAVSDSISAAWQLLANLEFSRDRKSMSVIAATAGGENTLFVKGAPEGIISRCSHIRLEDGSDVPLDDVARAALLEAMADMAASALRVLAFAVKEDLPAELADYDGNSHHPGHDMLLDTDGYAAIESDMVFVGMAGMLDPPRTEVRDSIDTCRKAGIRVIVITGDNKKTAEAICRKIGVFGERENVTGKSFTGREFMALGSDEQKAVLAGAGGRCFSRTEPRHKQIIVKLLKSAGEIVAMTGDGVNDAPALKGADIGIAMGITGTEVAKDASDMVLADDNFATIVSAVAEGRSIYNNMKAFIRYLISSNIGEVASIFFAAALGLPEVFIPVQLLWVNLVTDGPPATALGFNPPDVDIMEHKPRRADDGLISGWVFFRYMVIGVYVGLATIGIFAYWYIAYDWSDDGHTLISFYQLTHWTSCPTWDNFKVASFSGIDLSNDACAYFTAGKVKASTLSLSVLVLIEMLNALNALSEDGSLVTMPPWCNPWLLVAIAASLALHAVILYIPWLADIFSIAPMDFWEWVLVWAFSAPVLVLDEILKAVGRALAAKEQAARLRASKEQ